MTEDDTTLDKANTPIKADKNNHTCLLYKDILPDLIRKPLTAEQKARGDKLGDPAAKQLVTQHNLIATTDGLGYVLYNDTGAKRMLILENLYEEGDALTDFGQRQRRQQILDTMRRLGMSTGTGLDDELKLLSEFNPYNWLVNYIHKEPLTEPPHDEFKRWCDSMDSDTPLWPVHMHNFFLQVYQAQAWGIRFGVGEQAPPCDLAPLWGSSQGLGKSSSIAKILPPEMPYGVLSECPLIPGNLDAKDITVECLKYAVVELAEAGSMFRKGSVEALKSFLSRLWDSIRLPYARVAIPTPRMTCCLLTTNEAEVMPDDESRRTPYIYFTKIDLNFVMQHSELWRGIAYDYEVRGMRPTLTQEQKDIQRASNEQHRATSPGEDLIESYLSEYLDGHTGQWLLVNKSELGRLLNGGHNLSIADVHKMSSYMNRRYAKTKRIGGRFRCWCIPFTGQCSNKQGHVVTEGDPIIAKQGGPALDNWRKSR